MLVVTVFVAVVAKDGRPAETQTPVVRTVTSGKQAVQLARLRNTITEFRLSSWGCQDDLGVTRSRASVSVWALPASIAYRQWTANLWRKRSAACQVELKSRTIPGTGDWVTAVNIVQRIYPGTKEWMLYISGREGGHGAWVWYGGSHWHGGHVGNDYLGMDTVGGWMQFRYSTFAPYWRSAQADLKDRGFVIPEFPDRGGPSMYRAWLDPMGQALTAGFMRYTGRDACHWCI